MKLATFKTAQGTSYGIVTGTGIVDRLRHVFRHADRDDDTLTYSHLPSIRLSSVA